MITTNEGSTVNIEVENSGSDPQYQWMKDGGAITQPNVTGINAARLVISPAHPSNNGKYTVKISNNIPSSQTSSPSMLTVIPDLTKPAVVSALGQVNLANILVSFSEPVDTATAQNTANYTIGGLTVSSATVANGTNVLLVTTPRTAGNNYCITIKSVKDTADAGNVMNTVTLPLAQEVNLLTWNSVWKYNTNNLDGTGWQQSDFADGSWSMGPGLLGFENTPATITALDNQGTPTNTIIMFDEAANTIYTNLPTAYFRTKFNFTSDPGGIAFVMDHIVDDGAVFYLNGTEVGRFNMPTGAVVYSTLAPAAPAEAIIRQLPISGVRSGVNTLAVEVHQNALTSSDILFGVQLRPRLPAIAPSLGVSFDLNANTVTFTWPDASWHLQEATVVQGPYTPVTGNPASPYVVHGPAGVKFYRLGRSCP
jgi:hypothetical protein